jgi:hypothetical protein
MRSHLNQWLGMESCVCHPQLEWDGFGPDPIWKITSTEKSWWNDSSGRASASKYKALSSNPKTVKIKPKTPTLKKKRLFFYFTFKIISTDGPSRNSKLILSQVLFALFVKAFILHFNQHISNTFFHLLLKQVFFVCIQVWMLLNKC